jgi:hypothetical protein
MIVSVINHTAGRISDEEFQTVIRAVNRQIEGDFAPYWGFGARLRLEGRSEKRPGEHSLADMRGDAVLYVWDHVDPAAQGYHETNDQGIPYGYVFLDLSAALEEPWSVTLSHEALELIGDPENNLFAAGPHPSIPRRRVFHWFEMCDAVQAENYEIDDVKVSNFVLPLYFTSGAERGSRNDFLGRRHDGETLQSFGVNPGGYVGFFDPVRKRTGEHASDTRAARRLKIKQRAKRARRSVRKSRLFLAM